MKQDYLNNTFKRADIVAIIFVVLFGVLFCNSVAHAEPPELTIDCSVGAGETIPLGTSVSFSAKVEPYTYEEVDDEGEVTIKTRKIKSYQWVSSIAGVISTKPLFGTSIEPDKSDYLDVGTHVIMLTIVYDNDETNTAQITFTVGLSNAPFASITKPADNSSHPFGTLISFEGIGTDAGGTSLTDNSLRWSRVINKTTGEDELIGYGSPLEFNNLPTGTNTVKLTVTDNNGFTAFDTITVTIRDVKPFALITAPADNSVYPFGSEDISCVGQGTDAAGTEITDNNSFKWESTIIIDESGKPVDTQIPELLGYGPTPEPFKNLAPGTHKITLTVTDNNGQTGSDTVIIKILPANPVAAILLPADNSLLAFGDPVTFKGEVKDVEGGTLDLPPNNLKWESTLIINSDNEEIAKDKRVTELIGYGEEITDFKNLAVGKHAITFTVTDKSGLTGSDTITIWVRKIEPVAIITAPEDNSSYPFGSDKITFEGEGFDAAGVELDGNNLKWESTLIINSDGKEVDEAKRVTQLIGYGKKIDSFKNLAIGTHKITLTVKVIYTDGKEATGQDWIIIIIKNTPPVVTISKPTSGAKFNLNEYIQFEGKATDTEDGELKDSSLVWTSNRVTTTDAKTGVTTQTPLGTGNQISTNSLPIGENMITLTATDSNKLSATASVAIIVGTAALPIVEILKPADGSNFYLNEYIEFEGQATDSIYGELRGTSLSWKSNIQTSSLVDGKLGTGNILRINTLSIGEHLITLTAKYDDGKGTTGSEGSDFIVITVGNHPPVPVITYPNIDSCTFDEEEIINFAGSATDEEDGDLSGSALSWTSDIDGYLGSSVKFSKTLSSGEHTITLTAKDNNGGIARTTIKDSDGDTILVTVNPTDKNQPMTLESLSGSLPCESYSNYPCCSLDDMYISIPLGQIGDFQIKGGHPPYRYYKEHPYIASMNIIGKKIRIVPEIIGETTLQLVDHYNNKKIITLKVKDSIENVPRSYAGKDQNVVEGASVVLDGTESFKGNNGIASWNWSQVFDDNDNGDTYSNQRVVLLNSTSSKAMFVVPDLISSSFASDSSSKLTFRLTVSDKDANKSSDDIDINVSDNGILGYPQGVTTFYTVDRKNHLGMRVVGFGEFVYINPQAPEFIKESINRPENMIYGLVDLKIKVEQGADANMIVYFPKPLGEDFTAYKYSSSKGWYEYSGNITLSSDRKRVYVVLSDGGEGDDDGVADGVISDPITFGTKTKTPAVPETPSDGGGGGGCFISTLFDE